MGHPYWPLFDLVVRTPRLTLRYVDDHIGAEVAALAARGIHDPSMMPFFVPWTDAESPYLERGAFQFWWRCRAEISVERWNINYAVLVDDVVVGAGGISATDFPVLRTFTTGSWLGREYQRQGLGRELREAALHLGFDGFDAECALTGAFDDNAASLAVTRRLGYEPDGSRRVVRRGEPAVLSDFRMTRDHWLTIRRSDITIEGAEAARDLLGII
jgi:RimJ/RimL family protein N-acetyltransferase